MGFRDLGAMPSEGSAWDYSTSKYLSVKYYPDVTGLWMQGLV